jgi:hypothetical protein
MECTRWIPKLKITMGNYTLTYDFFVVDVSYTIVVLGVQWIYSIEKYTTNQRMMEMEFIGPSGKKVVLQAMHQYPPKIVSCHSMEAVMWHGDIEWAVECYISDMEPPDRPQQHPDDLQVLLRKHQKVFDGIPLGVPPDRVFEQVIELEEMGRRSHN